MARTIPSAFQSGADAAYGRLHILVKITDQPTSLYLTTAVDGLSYDSLTWDGDLHELKFSVGPEIDWRGGLAGDAAAAVSIIQGHASVTGTVANNTFALLKNLYDYITPVTGLYEAAILNESSGDVRISLVWDDGSPTAAESIEVFRGQSENLGQTNSGPLVVRLDPLRQRWLAKTFLRRFGSETADWNYDYGHASPRALYEPTRGRAVPICYGNVPYAVAVPVHTEPTNDDTVRSGLVLCLSDAAYPTFSPLPSADNAALYTVWGEKLDMISIERRDSSGNTQYEWGSSTHPEWIGGGSGGFQEGAFVRFTENTFAASATLLYSREDLLGYRSATESSDGSASTYSTYSYLHPSYAAHNWRMIDADLPGTVAQIFVRFKVYDTENDATNQYFKPSILVGGTEYPATICEVAGGSTKTCTFWDNYDTLTYSGFGISSTAISGKNTMGWGASGNWSSPLSLHDAEMVILNSASTSTIHTRWYIAQQSVWTQSQWVQSLDTLFGRCFGIRDSSYMTYSTDYLYNPAEIFEHFVTEVLGLSSTVDTTSAATAAAAMDTDGVRMDFQLIDGEMTAEDFLDKFALQSMSYIVPTNSGQERIIYRPSYHATALDYTYDPITSSDILKGTIKSEYTSRDDVRAGAIVNYAWNEAIGEFTERKIFVPTGHRLSSNFTNTTLQGWVDAIGGDFEAVEVDADLIQDETTAELLCKWLVQLHGRRRQILEFELPLEFAWIEAGDVIGVDHPMVRVYASGDSYELSAPAFPSNWPLEFKCSTATTTNPPVPGAADIVPIAHRGDLLFIEEGTLAGEHFHLYPANSGADIYISGGSVTSPVVTTAGDWRICPSFDVLSAKVTHSRSEGPRIAVRCIERPVLRAMSDSITD